MNRLRTPGARGRTLLAPGTLTAPLALSRAQVSAFSTALAVDGVTWTEFGADVPRYSSTPRWLLVEGQRTNLFTTARAPATETVTVTAAAHTLSFVGTGSITLSGVATGTLNGTGATNRVSLSFTPTAGALTLTVSGSVSLVQLELGAFASSPILPPVGSPGASTRGGDLVSVTLAPLGIGDNGVCTLLLSGLHQPTQNALLSVSDGTNNNRLSLRTNIAATAFTLEGRLSAANIGPVVQTGNPVASNTPWRVAFILPGDGTARCVGVAGATAVLTGGPTTGLTTLRVGSNESGANALFGEIAGLFVIPSALPDVTAQGLLATLPG